MLIKDANLEKLLLIVISGPIAAGKSTLARSLAGKLVESGISAVVVEIDLLHAMVLPSADVPDWPETWRWARLAASAMTDAFFAAGFGAVIVEGDFWNPGTREEFLEHLDCEVRPRFVTLTVSYEEALRRVKGEPWRGLSADPGFLKWNNDEFQNGLGDYGATDFILDSEGRRIEELADAIVGRFEIGEKRSQTR